MNRLIEYLTYREKNNPYQADMFSKVLLALALGCVIGILVISFLIQFK
jgi:hypothetical protein